MWRHFLRVNAQMRKLDIAKNERQFGKRYAAPSRWTQTKLKDTQRPHKNNFTFRDK